jgi:hypothetical protein
MSSQRLRKGKNKMNDYTSYQVRTYISGSVNAARENARDDDERALLDYTERYLLDLYASGQMVATWEKDDGTPTLSMVESPQGIECFVDSGVGTTTI